MGNTSSQISEEAPNDLWVTPSQSSRAHSKGKISSKRKSSIKIKKSAHSDARTPSSDSRRVHFIAASGEYLSDIPPSSSQPHLSSDPTTPTPDSSAPPIMDPEIEMPTPSAMKIFDTPQAKVPGSNKKGKKSAGKRKTAHFADAEANVLALQSQEPTEQPSNVDGTMSDMHDPYTSSTAARAQLEVIEAQAQANGAIEGYNQQVVYYQGDPNIDPSMQDHTENDTNFDPNLESPSVTPSKPKKRKRTSDQDASQPSKRLQIEGPQAPTIPQDDYPSAGPFTAAERDVVDRYAQAFLEEFRVDRESLNNIVQSKDRKMDDITREFWTQIYTILPNRDNKAMQRHVRRRFHNFTSRGKWSGDEDEMLKQAYEEKPNQWKHIGERLGRMPEDCRDRWRNYVICGESRKVDHWDDDEEAELSLAVNDCIQDIKNEAKNKAAEERLAFREDQDWESQINFNTVSEKLAHTRSRIQCLQHWKAMQEREATGKIKRGSARAKALQVPKKRKSGAGRKPGGGMKQHYMQMLPGDKFTILEAIIDTGSYEEDKIPWNLVVQRNPEVKWSIADRRYAFGRMKRLVPETENLQQTLQVLVQYFEHHHPNELELCANGPAVTGVSSDPQEPMETPATSQQTMSQHATTQHATSQAEGDEAIHPLLRETTQGTPSAAKEGKKARGRPKKNPDATPRSKKSSKNFKSNERVGEDGEGENGQLPAPQANMIGTGGARGRRNLIADLELGPAEGSQDPSQQLPGNPYQPPMASAASQHPADQYFIRHLGHNQGDAEPQLPRLRHDAGNDEVDAKVVGGGIAATSSPDPSPQHMRVRQSSELRA